MDVLANSYKSTEYAKIVCLDFWEKMESCKKNIFSWKHYYFLDFAKIAQQVCVQNFRVAMNDLHFIRIFFFFSFNATFYHTINRIYAKKERR